MSVLEIIDAASWKEFIAAPAAVLVLGKSDCENCARWTAELSGFAESNQEFRQVRFGKMMLDQPGLIDFKRSNRWVADLDVLPFTVIYVDGQRTRSFAGSGVERLVNRLRRVLAPER